MILIDGKPLDVNNLPPGVKIMPGGYIEQTENGMKTTVRFDGTVTKEQYDYNK